MVSFSDDVQENTWKIIDTYFRSNEYYFTRHHLDSYNDFVLNRIPYIVETLNPFVILKEALRIEVEVDHTTITMSPPKYGPDQKFLYPNIARLENRSYTADLRATMRIKYFENDTLVSEKEFKDKKFGSIPILVHSKLCYLHGLSPESLTKLGECAYDQGGYFIVDGKEKVIISQERIATNQLFISDPSDADRDSLEGMIRSTALTNALFPKSVRFWIEKVPNNPNNFYVRMNVMNIRLERIPIFVMFRALGIESDKDILEYITIGDNTMGHKEIQKLLHPSVVDGSNVLSSNGTPIYTQEQALRYLSNFVKHDNIEYVQYVFINDMFPNIGDNFREKALYLGYLVNKMVKTAIGAIKQNRRDNYMFKRVDTTGILIGNIFRDFYNKYRNHVRSSIDREFTMGGMNNRLNLVTEGNFSRIFPSRIIDDHIHKSMKGNWGLTGDPSEQGIVQDVSRLSYVSYISHVRRVNTPIDRSIKLVEPHRLDTPQWGMMCPIESPDGGNIGLLKHMAVTCEITLESKREDIMKCLDDLNLIPLQKVDPYTIRGNAKVHLNNNWIGIHDDPETLVKTMKKYRRSGVLNAFVSVTWKIDDNEVMIYSDSGRCCRPLLVSKSFENMNTDEKEWSKLVSGYTYKYTYDKPTQKQELKESAIEYVDCFESNSIYVAMRHKDLEKKRHTHVEIHPCLHLSVYTNTIPLANHNQAPRNVFSGQQGKQALGIYATNFNHRIDTASYLLHYPQRALLSTKIAHYAHKNQMPNGENLIVAIATYTGYNQEDSVILNSSSVARGMFNVTAFKSIVESETVNENSGVSLLFDNPKKLKKEGKEISYRYADWTKIDDDGFPIKNAHIDEDDAYLGMVAVHDQRVAGDDTDDNTVFNEKATQKVYKDVSKIAKKTVSGTVDNVIHYPLSDGMRQVKIRMRKFKVPELGDKMASTHGQKGVCGMVIPQEDMPHTKNGLVPDIIVNPHAFPSRMTIGHLIECVLAKLGCLQGSYIDGTPFEDHCINDYYKMMERHGYQKHGDELMYNGYTGEQMKTEIFIGPTFYHRLKHMVKDKINYRAGGPVELMTRQPTQGRANGGGLRIGEMETNAILAHGIISFVKESMMERSDGYYKYIDSRTGEDIVNNEKIGYYDSLYAQKVEVPYSWKLLQQELEGMAISTKLLVEK